MLDYDSVRSKVKKLTEKPDKDPGKLPRTEKEADMVIAPFLLFQDIPSPLKEEDLLPFSSPPKVLDGIRRKPVWVDVDAEEDAAIRSVGANNLRRSSSLYRTASRVSSLVGNALARSPSSPISPSDSPKEDHATTRLAVQDNTPTRKSPASERYRASLRRDNINTTPSISITPAPKALQSTPFFHPSELDDIMAPIKKEFVIQQADLCAQAKAAYEQLNQQLTDELPQLIDLRYVYSRPSAPTHQQC